MPSNGNPTALQPRRYSGQQNRIIRRGRTDMPISRTSFIKQNYFKRTRTEVNLTQEISSSIVSFLLFFKGVSINEQFIRACVNGDYRTVQQMLDASQITNIDVTNQLGRTAMQLAIENEHLEVNPLRTAVRGVFSSF